MPENDIQRGGLKLKKTYYETPSAPEPAAPEIPVDPATRTDGSPTPFHRKRDSSAKKKQNILILAGWVLCIVAGAALVYLRFFADLPAPVPESLKFYGMIAIGLVYLLSIALALKDNMFDGLLAIVVPLYPLYYLYATSGSIFLRAIATALLAAFGYDCALLIQIYALKVINGISYWISNV